MNQPLNRRILTEGQTKGQHFDNDNPPPPPPPPPPPIPRADSGDSPENSHANHD
jgi:hypothetical protein